MFVCTKSILSNPCLWCVSIPFLPLALTVDMATLPVQLIFSVAQLDLNNIRIVQTRDRENVRVFTVTFNREPSTYSRTHNAPFFNTHLRGNDYYSDGPSSRPN